MDSTTSGEGPRWPGGRLGPISIGRVAPATEIGPWSILVGLLLLCAAKGCWFVSGLTVPPDPDIVRDLGFVRGAMHGYLFGDPSSEGAWRWYPPLVHWIAAAMVSLL